MIFKTSFDKYRKDGGVMAVYKDFISLIKNDHLKFPILTMKHPNQTYMSRQLCTSIHKKILLDQNFEIIKVVSAFSVSLLC